MRILVTGAAGHIGSATVAQCVAAGHEVLATDRRFRSDIGCPLRVRDLRDSAAAYELLDGIEAVIHLGNRPSLAGNMPTEVFQQNVAINANLFQAALEMRTPLVIYASSIQVHACIHGAVAPRIAPAHLPLDAHLPLAPGNAYAASKAAGETYLEACMHQGLAGGVVVRLPAITRRASLLGSEVRAWLARREQHWEGQIHLRIEDAADLFVALAEARPAGFHKLLPGWPQPLSGISAEDLRQTMLPTVPVKGGEPPLSCYVDLSEVTALTGWVPRRSFFDAP